MSLSQPRAQFRPRGEAWLMVYRDDDRIEVSLDSEVTDLPPHLDARRTKPPVFARVQRVPGGHRIIPGAGVRAKVNGRPIEGPQILRGGDEIDVEARFYAVYTTAKEELPWPMTLVVWPPDGPPLEIRTHRTRVTLGATDADLTIDDPTLDGLHCIVKRFRNGIMQIEDTGSYNGVYVDGQKVHEGMTIRDGAEIRIGNTRVKAWAEAPDVPDLSTMPVGDQFDGLPSDGYDPASSEPLRPYALELGPDYVQNRRRTMADDVPTKQNPGGERVEVRPRKRPGDRDSYADQPEAADGSAVPGWAPLDVNAPRRRNGERSKGEFQDSVTGADWADRDKGGHTLVHKKDRAIKPRKGK